MKALVAVVISWLLVASHVVVQVLGQLPTAPPFDYILSLPDQVDDVTTKQCRLRKSSAGLPKTVYKVGVLGNRGIETLYKEYNMTFETYLTTTAGQRFDPPISFEIHPFLFGEQGILDTAVSGTVDFTFMNPALYSCVESEANANSLVTLLNKRVVNGVTHGLSQFGGVIFVRHDNTNVQSVADVQGKRVATTSATSLGSGQMQFREMQQVGLHQFQDVQQLIFMESQERVVHAVIRGEVEVGFVRTDQLERSSDPETGEPLDMSLVRIIQDRTGIPMNNGNPFPVVISTYLYPEWPFASLPHVPSDVTLEVQRALLEMDTRASLAAPLRECFAAKGCNDFPQVSFQRSQCEYSCFADLDEAVTTCTLPTYPSIALLADQAMNSAKSFGWVPSSSYMTIRNMQEETGFITTTDSGQIRCLRTTELVDAVTCPPGHFKRSDDEIVNGCATVGLDCYGFQCLCSPCVKAYDVDFYAASTTNTNIRKGEGKDQQQQQTNNNNNTDTNHGPGTGCAKFEVCGEVEQMEQITFRIVDNKKRANAVFTANVLITEVGELYTMTPPDVEDNSNSSSTLVVREFVFDGTDRPVGVFIVQVFVDGEQIPESPFRFRIVRRNCEDELVPDRFGYCMCPEGSIRVGDACVNRWTITTIAIAGTLALIGLVAWIVIDRKHRQMDAIWKVRMKELVFDEPPRELGKGAFGVVLLAEYRGTQVAVKRVLPKRAEGKLGSRGSVKLGKTRNSYLLDRLEKGEYDASQQRTDVTASMVGSVTNLAFFNRKTVGLRKIQRDFVREMRMLSKLRHPCVVSVMGAVVSPNEIPQLIMEYLELGSLYDLLHNSSTDLSETSCNMLQDIAQGLRFLHSADPPIVHADLKAQNVFVDRRFHAKVGDFGLSTRGVFKLQGTVAGSPLWMAPELLRKETWNTVESDVWAFGILISEMLTRKDPFHGEDIWEVLKAVADPKENKMPSVERGVYPDAKKLMWACLRKKPEERPKADEIDIRVKQFEHEKFAMNQSRKSTRTRNTEDLLSELFPKHIADAMREGRTVEPESHDCVTVYFSDIVGYTNISSELTPEKVSSLLHRLYSKFDNLCEDHDVFKVETVGDAYMVCANLTNKRNDHVVRIANFSFDAIKAAAETRIDEDDPDRGNVQIRCGFHIGPVVTHVVGHRNPRYSVIGDVVNTASRMESNSLPMQVNVSKVTSDMLQEEYPGIVLSSRGVMNVKGKGKMELFWVEPPNQVTFRGRRESAIPESRLSAETVESFANEEPAPAKFRRTSTRSTDGGITARFRRSSTKSSTASTNSKKVRISRGSTPKEGDLALQRR
ncbi:activated protein kinase catalytic subunit alpha-1 [Seminavis robusta]|uniref:guanylate cyclase n=1 Tax=Seminavis robusta TaxID=568900 RepID=A0A9N8E464_9STRA|nr:activated protein kinase catalytic subunit alpha-1 [Seminavis robusta]|eukprot:Sro601_g173460.1 activated protein kinase catalytic subunit alpha-1 (1316) ;mRNA; f:9919-14851